MRRKRTNFQCSQTCHEASATLAQAKNEKIAVRIRVMQPLAQNHVIRVIHAGGNAFEGKKT
jgi:hypothetical protein